MRETIQRRFGLLDLMIVIAGVAFALWITPETLAPTFGRVIEFAGRDWRSRTWVIWSGLLLVRSQPIAAVLTLTILVLAYRGSPSYRRLTDHPGSMACMAAVLAILVVAPFSHADTRFGFSPNIPPLELLRYRVVETLTFQRAEGGVAVATAWLTLVIGGRWLHRAGAIDWAGRLIGIYWIATLPLTWLCLPS
jgi:hypothetical protein